MPHSEFTEHLRKIGYLNASYWPAGDPWAMLIPVPRPRPQFRVWHARLSSAPGPAIKFVEYPTSAYTLTVDELLSPSKDGSAGDPDPQAAARQSSETPGISIPNAL